MQNKILATIFSILLAVSLPIELALPTKANLALLGAGSSRVGGGGFDPSLYCDVVAWYRASDQTYMDGDTVTTITDSSGNGHTLTQGGLGSATFETGVINGLPVIRTADNTEFFDTAGDPYDDTQGQTYYFVAKQETNDVSVFISDALNVSVLPGFLNSTTIRTWTNTVANVADVTIDDATAAFKIYRITQRATTMANGTTTVKQAGVDKGTTASRDRGSFANLRVGYNATQSFQGDWAEILICNGEETSSEIDDHFADDYGL